MQGHEVDSTIADFVADQRAPTPSAAAELVCKNAGELIETIQTRLAALLRNWNHAFNFRKQRLQHAVKRLVDPKRRLQDLAMRCDELSQRLDLARRRHFERLKVRIDLLANRLPSPQERISWLSQKVSMQESRLQSHVIRRLDGQRARLGQLSSVLDSLSPLKVVERGYSIVKKENTIVKNTTQLKQGDRLQITFAKGQAEVLVEKIKES